MHLLPSHLAAKVHEFQTALENSESTDTNLQNSALGAHELAKELFADGHLELADKMMELKWKLALQLSQDFLEPDFQSKDSSYLKTADRSKMLFRDEQLSYWKKSGETRLQEPMKKKTTDASRVLPLPHLNMLLHTVWSEEDQKLKDTRRESAGAMESCCFDTSTGTQKNTSKATRDALACTCWNAFRIKPEKKFWTDKVGGEKWKPNW